MAVTFTKSGVAVKPNKTKNYYTKAITVENLGLEHLAALDSYLLADHSIDKLVVILQNEWGHFKDKNPAALRRMLFRYKASMIVGKQAAIAAKHSGDRGLAGLAAQLTALEKRMDPILSLELLIGKQQERVAKMEKLEANAPTLLDNQTKNIALLTDMLFKLVNAHLDTGILHRVPKKLNVAAVDVSDEERKFMETGRLVDAQAGFLVQAMRHLREAGVVDVASRDVDGER